MKKKVIIICIVLLLSILITQTYVFGYNTFYDHVMVGGVGDWGKNRRYFFITTSASTLSSYINQAVNEWIYTTDNPGVSTPISFRHADVIGRSQVDFYYGEYEDERTGIYATTKQYIHGELVMPYYADWAWSAIHLNKVNFDKLPTNYYGNQKVGTIAHEMGHAMGLDENNGNVNSIMCQFGEGRRVARAQVDDLNGINHLYP